MSGLEHYDRELASLDSEIHRYAVICGIDLGKRPELEACLKNHRADWADDKARESLQGLLLLRGKVEAEMLAEGLTPPPLLPPAPDAG